MNQLLYAFSPFWQIGIVALLGFYGFVAWQGHFDLAPEARANAARHIAIIVAVFAFDVIGTHAGLADAVAGTITTFAEFSGAIVGVSILFLLPYFLIRFAKRFIMGWHYVFIAHPAAPVVDTAVATQSPINAPALSHALTPSPCELAGKPAKFAFQYRSDATKAEELRRKLDADRRIAEAAIARERAIAASRDTR